MTRKSPKSLMFFASITLILVGVIAYLGFRTIEHEVLRRQHQALALAQTRSEQVAYFVMNLLQQKAARLDAMTGFVQTDAPSLSALEADDNDIDSVFVLRNNGLLYPDERLSLTQTEKDWVRLVTPLAHDPSLLHSHIEKAEGETLRSGWLMTSDANEPALIYWRYRGRDIVGLRVDYVKLLSDIINAADFHFAPDEALIRENGRVLYRSGAEVSGSETVQLLYSVQLPYPLNAWQVKYYGVQTGMQRVYWWGGAYLLLMILIVCLAMFRLYREYTQTARLARQQVNFVGQVSHELKTPLTNIALYAELLKEELDEQCSGARYTDIIAGESQRLSRLIQNILSFTRAPKTHIQAVELRQLLTQIVHTFTPSFQAKGIDICVDIPDAVTVDSDIDRLTQIIGNLLSNAEKYAAQGKRVDIAVERHPDAVDIHVRDYGKGIARKEARKIFQPFYRIQSGITEGVAGTGIGLTIAAQLAEALHGQILVSHPEPGVRFTLRLHTGPRT